MKVISYALLICCILFFSVFGTFSDEIFPPQEGGYQGDYIMISTPGKYILERDIHHSYPVGVIILSSSVVFSGNDHLISPSSPGEESVGIWIAAYDSQGIPITGVTLSDLHIEGEAYGIFIEGDDFTPFSWTNDAKKPVESTRQKLLTPVVEIFSSTISSCATAIGISDGVGVRITDGELAKNEYGVTASGRDLEIANTIITQNSKAGIFLDGTIGTSLSQNTITENNIGIEARNNSIDTLNEIDNIYENKQDIVTDEEDTPTFPAVPTIFTLFPSIFPPGNTLTEADTTQDIMIDEEDIPFFSIVPVLLSPSPTTSPPGNTFTEADTTQDTMTDGEDTPFFSAVPSLLPFFPTTSSPDNLFTEATTTQDIVTDEEGTPFFSAVPSPFPSSHNTFPLENEKEDSSVESVPLQTTIPTLFSIQASPKKQEITSPEILSTTFSPFSSVISTLAPPQTPPLVTRVPRTQFPRSIISGTHATIISDTIPDVLSPESRNQVSITIANTGSIAWKADEGIGISAVGDTSRYAPEWLPIPASESGKNREYVLDFTLLAPATPGAYTFSFRAEKRREEMTSTFGRPYTKTVIIS